MKGYQSQKPMTNSASQTKTATPRYTLNAKYVDKICCKKARICVYEGLLIVACPDHEPKFYKQGVEIKKEEVER